MPPSSRGTPDTRPNPSVPVARSWSTIPCAGSCQDSRSSRDASVSAVLEVPAGGACSERCGGRGACRSGAGQDRRRRPPSRGALTDAVETDLAGRIRLHPTQVLPGPQPPRRQLLHFKRRDRALPWASQLRGLPGQRCISAAAASSDQYAWFRRVPWMSPRSRAHNRGKRGPRMARLVQALRSPADSGDA
jgi:hypothetical protein